MVRRTEGALGRGEGREIQGVVDARLGAHGRDGALDAGLGAVKGGHPRVADGAGLDGGGVTELSRHGALGRVALACREGGGAEHADEGEEMHGGWRAGSGPSMSSSV